MTTRRLPLTALLAVLAGGVASAHPVPKDTHLRTITVRVRPGELFVRYRLELDEFTAVNKDSKDLIDAAEVKDLRTPSAFYREFTHRLGPLLAAQLDATLDGQPVELRCLEEHFEVSDHLVCEYQFQADWTLAVDRDHRLEFHDGTYKYEPGNVRLSLDEDPALEVDRRAVPPALLQARNPIDLGRGDDAKLRTVTVTFRTSGPSGPAAPAIVPPSTPKPAGAHSTLLALLDAPHGFSVLIVLATLFGAAHALTPGHGKTLVAAYLVGERGTIWHAVVLGITTTLTHTGAVIVIAAGLLWWYPDGAPEKVQAILGFTGGMLIAGLGLWLLLKRLSGGADHVHGPGGHTHNPDGTITFIPRPEGAGWGRLILLGVSGGIIPCWDAIAMLGFAIAAQRLWLALPLLLAFSAGLAGVLVLIGIAVVCARSRVSSRWSESWVWRLLPLASAAVLLVMGLWLCRDSLAPG
jgi:ABC-type nickel/cobalt efflux system permease component RcnA